jgi:hypothetical protein
MFSENFDLPRVETLAMGAEMGAKALTDVSAKAAMNSVLSISDKYSRETLVGVPLLRRRPPRQKTVAQDGYRLHPKAPRGLQTKVFLARCEAHECGVAYGLVHESMSW